MEATVTREDCLSWFEGCCIDFWGEKKTAKSVKEAWECLLASLREDGEKVPDYKLTKEEIRRLVKYS